MENEMRSLRNLVSGVGIAIAATGLYAALSIGAPSTAKADVFKDILSTGAVMEFLGRHNLDDQDPEIRAWAELYLALGSRKNRSIRHSFILN